MSDSFWRYQGELIAQSIKFNSNIPFNEFPRHSFIIHWTNTFTDNFAGPLIVAMLSTVIDIETLRLHNSPLFLLPLVLSTAVIASRLANRKSVFLISIILSLGFKSIISNITFSAHRGALGWALLITILAVLSVNTNRAHRKSFVLAIPLIAVLPMAVHTLPLAAILLIVNIWILSVLAKKNFINSKHALIYIFGMVLYDLFVFDWLIETIFKFQTTLLAISISSPSQFLSSIGTSSGLHPLLKPYLTTLNSGTLFSELTSYSLLTSAMLITSLFCYRVYYIFSAKDVYSGLTKLDVVFAAVLIQGVSYVTILPLFAPSGGINPVTFGTIMTPLFGSISVHYIGRSLSDERIRFKVNYTLVISVLCMVVILPGFIGLSIQAYTDGQEAYSTTSKNIQQSEWAQSYLKQEQRITSDFNSISRYYALGGRSRTSVPSPGVVPYTTKTTASRLEMIYYTSPSVAATNSDVYMVTYQMQRNAIIHLASIETQPNPSLSIQLSSSGKWQKAYTSGQSSTFVNNN